VITLDGTNNGVKEATSYENKLRALTNENNNSNRLPCNEAGYPICDLILVGVGDDDHISLYPNRPEVLYNGESWILPVDIKDPPSIIFTLPVILAARNVVVAACGVSDKYPAGKGDAMRKAIYDTNEASKLPPEEYRS
jgi:6-phosphogluconolactonase